jgi:hypothetical protein
MSPLGPSGPTGCAIHFQFGERETTNSGMSLTFDLTEFEMKHWALDNDYSIMECLLRVRNGPTRTGHSNRGTLPKRVERTTGRLSIVGRDDATGRAASEVGPFLLIQFHRPSTAEGAVVTRLQICVDIINIGGDVGIAGETLHVRSALRNAFQHNMTERINVEKSIDEGRRESRARAVWAMAVIAGGVVPPEAVIRSCVDLTVDDAVEAALERFLLRTECCTPHNSSQNYGSESEGREPKQLP